eukprot:6430297-Prymnesium_polylepis.1
MAVASRGRQLKVGRMVCEQVGRLDRTRAPVLVGARAQARPQEAEGEPRGSAHPAGNHAQQQLTLLQRCMNGSFNPLAPL